MKSMPPPAGPLAARLNFSGWTSSSLTSVPQHAVRVHLDPFGVATTFDDRPINRQRVPLLNGRELHDLRLDREGIALMQHAYPHVNYYDPDDVVPRYYTALENIIKYQIEGSRKVIVFNHQVRSYKKDLVMGGQRKPKDPVMFCHSDYSLDGAERCLRRLGEPTTAERSASLLSAEEVEEHIAGKRYMILHAWRNISPLHALRSQPLALCCADSVRNHEDLVAYDLVYADRTDSVMALKYNESQRWLYFPDMHRDELLIFKQFDNASRVAVNYRRDTIASSSNQRLIQNNNNNNTVGSEFSDEFGCDDISCWVPHSAFDAIEAIPHAAERQIPGREEQAILLNEEKQVLKSHCPGRESIEASVIVLY